VLPFPPPVPLPAWPFVPSRRRHASTFLSAIRNRGASWTRVCRSSTAARPSRCRPPASRWSHRGLFEDHQPPFPSHPQIPIDTSFTPIDIFLRRHREVDGIRSRSFGPGSGGGGGSCRPCAPPLGTSLPFHPSVRSSSLPRPPHLASPAEESLPRGGPSVSIEGMASISTSHLQTKQAPWKPPCRPGWPNTCRRIQP